VEEATNELMWVVETGVLYDYRIAENKADELLGVSKKTG
jgi:hypothetical protein